VGYCYPSGLEKTLCKWDIYVPLVMKGLRDYKPFVAINLSSLFKNVITSCSQLVGRCCERVELRCWKKERMKEL
jgi:hypothetical protein